MNRTNQSIVSTTFHDIFVLPNTSTIDVMHVKLTHPLIPIFPDTLLDVEVGLSIKHASPTRTMKISCAGTLAQTFVNVVIGLSQLNM